MSGSNSSAPRDAAAEAPTGPEPLALAVHGMDPPDLADPRLAGQRTRRGRLKVLLVLLVCAAPVIASYLMYYVIRPEGRTNYGTLVQPTRTLPATLPLTTLAGEAVAPATLRGQWLLVAVGPSACEAACERRLYLQRQLREMLGRERDRLDKLWLVTDGGQPAPALRAALESAPAMQILRAPADAVAAWLQPEAGRAIEDHFYLVDPLGEWMLRLPPDPEPARVKRDLERLLRASASWDRAGR